MMCGKKKQQKNISSQITQIVSYSSQLRLHGQTDSEPLIMPLVKSPKALRVEVSLSNGRTVSGVVIGG